MDKFLILLICLSGIPIVYCSGKELLSVFMELVYLLQRDFHEEDFKECDCPDCDGKSLAEILEEKKEMRKEIITEAISEIRERIFVLIFYTSITALSIKYYLTN